MTDLQAAAERLRHNRYAHDIYGDRARDRDRATLADAYLSSHPADGEEPLTEEWWRDQCGGLFHPSVGAIQLYFGPNEGVVELCVYGHNDEYWESLPHIRTRGDLRRLAAALGITLKEPQA